MRDAHPIGLTVAGDLGRSRLTTLLRPLLALPHLARLAVRVLVAVPVAVAAWIATVAGGAAPRRLHDHLAGLLRDGLRVHAYVYLLADRYPPFTTRAAHPVDLLVAPPAPQSRPGAAFRALVALPALAASVALAVLAGILAAVSWIAVLATGRVPRRARDLGARCARFIARTGGHLLLVTGRYPSLSLSPAERAPRD